MAVYNGKVYFMCWNGKIEEEHHTKERIIRYVGLDIQSGEPSDYGITEELFLELGGFELIILDTRKKPWEWLSLEEFEKRLSLLTQKKRLPDEPSFFIS